MFTERIHAEGLYASWFSLSKRLFRTLNGVIIAPMLNQRRPIVTLLVLLSLLLSPCFAWSDQKSPFFYALEAELLGGYSEVVGHDGEFSSIDSWLVSPNWKMNDSLYWINVYNGSYNRSAQVVSQEEGGRQTQETQTHSIATSLKKFINDKWSLRPLFFADWVLVNETRDENFGDGLYDYRQLGGGLESSWETFKSASREDNLRLGFRYLRREYPNYRSLLSLFNPNGSIETNEKDLDGYKINLSHDTKSKSDWSWGLEGIFFFKDYTDKKTIDSNGIRTSDTREDFVEGANVYISHPVQTNFIFRLDGQFQATQSNLDFYDTHNTPGFSDDDFVKDYFDNFTFLVKPSLTYFQKWGEDRNFTVTADYTFNALHYTGRKAQNTAGQYQADDQQDYTHIFTGKVNVPATPNISWVSFGSYAVGDSNQDFESFYLYNYDLWTAVTGISFKY